LCSRAALALYAYAARPSRARLALFFAIYALGFGNHLSMILLLVPFAVFLLQVTPNRRTLFSPGSHRSRHHDRRRGRASVHGPT
jgi:hypothetical protein